MALKDPWLTRSSRRTDAVVPRWLTPLCVRIDRLGDPHPRRDRCRLLKEQKDAARAVHRLRGPDHLHGPPVGLGVHSKVRPVFLGLSSSLDVERWEG